MKHLNNVKTPETSLEFKMVDTWVVQNIIRKMKNKNSSGDDGFSNMMIKENSKSLVGPLAKLISTSLESGLVPKSFKIAKVVPVFKTGNEKVFDNLRPISLLSSFSKILEKIVTKQLVDFLKRQEILYNSQFGFQEGNQTQHAIIKLMDRIANNKSKNFTHWESSWTSEKPSTV